MRKRKPLKLWAVYRLEKTGKRLGSVQAATEKEALEEAYKQFGAKTEAERKGSISAANESSPGQCRGEFLFRQQERSLSASFKRNLAFRNETQQHEVHTLPIRCPTGHRRIIVLERGMRAFRSARFKRLAFACLLPMLVSSQVLAADDRPWMGMDIADYRFENRVLGVGVARVEDGSPAFDAGIIPGGVLVSMEGMALAGSDDLICRIFVLTAGQRVRLALLRDGDLRSFTVTLAL